jgi:NADP-dependent 3-hydroxy acid dehydrogenase YdfG
VLPAIEFPSRYRSWAGWRRPSSTTWSRCRALVSAISPDAVARAIAFAVEQPYDVEIGDITVRPAVQG